MQCDYFDAGACRSCTLMGTGYAAQLARKQGLVGEVLAAHVPAAAWLPPQESRESGFRNKAKLVAGGRKGAPTLGILDGGGRGVDLRHCGLHEEPLHRAILTIAELLAGSGLTPYDVASRQGELKHLLLTISPDQELMARFVLRSPGQLPRVRELLAALAAALPGLRVVGVNLQPEHKAVLEGEEEILLTAQRTLPMRVGGLTLHLGTRSFFQTNTAVATALYRQVADWVEELDPASVADLYCGVGGFALHCAGGPARGGAAGAGAVRGDAARDDAARGGAARGGAARGGAARDDAPRGGAARGGADHGGAARAGDADRGSSGMRRPSGAAAGSAGRSVLGIEVAPEAIASAQLSALELGVQDRVRFVAADATAYLAGEGDSPTGPTGPTGPAGLTGPTGPSGPAPEAVVVNPPRRGIGPRLAGWLEQAPVRHLVYSSCNATSLAADLARMPSWQVERARLFDMFPQTDHHEVVVLLSRR